MPEFLFIGGRSNSGTLGSSAASSVVDTVPKTKPTNYRLFSTCKIDIGQKLEVAYFLAGVSQGEEGSPAVQAEADQQRGVHQAEQGHHQHAQDLW